MEKERKIAALSRPALGCALARQRTENWEYGQVPLSEEAGRPTAGRGSLPGPPPRALLSLPQPHGSGESSLCHRPRRVVGRRGSPPAIRTANPLLVFVRTVITVPRLQGAVGWGLAKPPAAPQSLHTCRCTPEGLFPALWPLLGTSVSPPRSSGCGNQRWPAGSARHWGFGAVKGRVFFAACLQAVAFPLPLAPPFSSLTL